MKKLMLFGALAFASLISAQETNLKGRTFITGSVGYSNDDNSNEYSVKSFNIKPTFGYFVTNDIAVGLGIGYENSKVTSVSSYNLGNQVILVTYENKADAFFINPMVRKYWNIGDKLYLFGQFDINFSKGTSESYFTGSTPSKVDIKTLGFNVKPGLDYFLNKNWTLEATIGNLGYTTVKRDDVKSKEKFDLGVSFSNINFGLKYIF